MPSRFAVTALLAAALAVSAAEVVKRSYGAPAKQFCIEIRPKDHYQAPFIVCEPLLQPKPLPYSPPSYSSSAYGGQPQTYAAMPAYGVSSSYAPSSSYASMPAYGPTGSYGSAPAYGPSVSYSPASSHGAASAGGSSHGQSQPHPTQVAPVYGGYGQPVATAPAYGSHSQSYATPQKPSPGYMLHNMAQSHPTTYARSDETVQTQPEKIKEHLQQPIQAVTHSQSQPAKDVRPAAQRSSYDRYDPPQYSQPQTYSKPHSSASAKPSYDPYQAPSHSGYQSYDPYYAPSKPSYDPYSAPSKPSYDPYQAPTYSTYQSYDPYPMTSHGGYSSYDGYQSMPQTVYGGYDKYQMPAQTSKSYDSYATCAAAMPGMTLNQIILFCGMPPAPTYHVPTYVPSPVALVPVYVSPTKSEDSYGSSYGSQQSSSYGSYRASTSDQDGSSLTAKNASPSQSSSSSNSSKDSNKEEGPIKVQLSSNGEQSSSVSGRMSEMKQSGDDKMRASEVMGPHPQHGAMSNSRVISGQPQMFMGNPQSMNMPMH